MRNIKDYGAVGDGVALDTAAIQKAINDGGMVYIPEGVYRTGTLYLKSNGGLHLAPGAILRASHDREDYNADDFCPQNEVFTSEWVTGAHLIVAVEQENITIEGHGTIDGEGRHWMTEYDESIGAYRPNPERPGQMIFFCECRNVHVTDVNLSDSPYWHLFLHGCEDVFVKGLTIRGVRPRWTNDGIDIDCCKRVTVSGCVIDVGDDAIAVRAHKKPLLHSDGVCEQITISNCVIRADQDYGMRIGVGSGTIRNVTVSNMDIEALHWGGIGIMGCWSSGSKYATTIENVLFSNINLRARRPIELYVCANGTTLPNPCHIDNIRFSNCFISAIEHSFFRGLPDERATNITMDGVTVRLDDNWKDETNVFDISCCDNVTINGFRVTGSTQADAIKRVSCENSNSVEINGARKN